MATTEQKSINSIKKGSSIVLDGEPCRVIDVTSSKAGKHGHAKIRLVAVGMFDEKKREMVMPSGQNIEVPMVEKKTAQVLSVSGDTAKVMDAESFEMFDMHIPEELIGQVVDGCEVLYWDVMNKLVIRQVK